jgi:hypothetical protein
MSTQNRFEPLLPKHLSDEVAYSLWECLRELTMICEEKYGHQIGRGYAQRCMLDATEIDDALPEIDDRQIEIPF